VIPSLFVTSFNRALLIGLGTGHSALALKQLGYKRVDIAEFSPGIVVAAAGPFSRLNGNALSEPSVKLHLEDGRNLLLTESRDSYDLITIEISSIWFAGSTNLYSKEFYHLAKSRLKPGGVLQQWVQLHHISPAEIASAAASVRAVFPYVSLWNFGGHGMMVATMRPQVRTEERTRLLAEVVQPLIESAGGARNVLDLLVRSEVVSCPGMDGMLATLRPTINTDHNRWIEFATPRYNSSNYDWAAHNVGILESFERKAEARISSARP
jgi:spermidine synthase